MSVFCKGCRKTKVNEDFGLKTDGNQYKTCIKCRNKKIKNIEKEEEIIECCDAELIRDTFRKLNCRIVYLKELKYMMDLDKHVAISIFSKMIMYNNIAIIETITSDNFCSFMNLLTHLEIYTMGHHISQFGVNFVIYKNSKDSLMRITTESATNIFEGFMKCLKLPNKKMCDICNNKKKCFRECAKCKHKLCVECFKNHNKNYVNSCPYCRNNIEEHSKMNKLMEELLGDGIQMF